MVLAYLGARDTQETYRHQDSCNCHLIIAELYSVKILHAETVRGDETVEREDLVHLNCGY